MLTCLMFGAGLHVEPVRKRRKTDEAAVDLEE